MKVNPPIPNIDIIMFPGSKIPSCLIIHCSILSLKLLMSINVTVMRQYSMNIPKDTRNMVSVNVIV